MSDHRLPPSSLCLRFVLCFVKMSATRIIPRTNSSTSSHYTDLPTPMNLAPEREWKKRSALGPLRSFSHPGRSNYVSMSLFLGVGRGGPLWRSRTRNQLPLHWKGKGAPPVSVRHTHTPLPPGARLVSPPPPERLDLREGFPSYFLISRLLSLDAGVLPPSLAPSFWPQISSIYPPCLQAPPSLSLYPAAGHLAIYLLDSGGRQRIKEKQHT